MIFLIYVLYLVLRLPYRSELQSVLSFSVIIIHHSVLISVIIPILHLPRPFLQAVKTPDFHLAKAVAI